jgi:hypothetical protein
MAPRESSSNSFTVELLFQIYLVLDWESANPKTCIDGLTLAANAPSEYFVAYSYAALLAWMG